ncbi:LiaI-LiaF-like domain-containing protein [Siphonobacter aquaeclarae]|uniref:LiaI-LiaF-like transmembrane region domain-containing protein n=1 Tax=Siphonobacter aquaeclarae TaxID=563176 RepID=A0A1G9UD71_9BACT|nr:DUF5668 domain-containing protein [Siphonobacter aquaeclarae]MBO9637223.1 hypothetical protein [Siphonobacter aquaeclarae]SDM57858.1 hypothetical protein SAMN04488090_3774 [Siphonobacter aquaeclarae]
MNTKNLFLGGFLVLLGFLFLGRNMGWFDFHFGEIFRYWPLLFVVLGINFIWGKSNRNVTVVTLILLAIAIPFFIATKVRDRIRDNAPGVFRYDGDNDDDDFDIHIGDDDDEDNSDEEADRGGGKQYLAEPMADSIRTASFRLEGGAAEFTMGTSDKQLAEADGNLDFGNLNLKTVSGNGGNQVTLSMKGHGKWKWHKESSHNDVAVRLNPRPIWDLDMKVGAGKVDFDLSPFQIRKIKLETGAAEMDLKLGDRSDNLEVDVDAGVASVEIKVPQSVGCRIETHGALTDKNFQGFTRIGDAYETPGYSSAKKKINIRFDGGIAEWKVERY